MIWGFSKQFIELGFYFPNQGEFLDDGIELLRDGQRLRVL